MINIHHIYIIILICHGNIIDVIIDIELSLCVSVYALQVPLCGHSVLIFLFHAVKLIVNVSLLLVTSHSVNNIYDNNL